MERTNIEWVGQVSLLRPGFFSQMGLGRKTQVSQKRDLAHPLEVWGLRLILTKRSAVWDLRVAVRSSAQNPA
jgi:hypothetical protein